MSALLVTIFLTTMNIANAVSFPFSSPPLSPLQSYLQQQQQPLDTDGTIMTRNSNEQQMMHHPFPFFPPQSASLQSQLPPHQQQQNQPQQQSLDTNRMSNSHNKDSNNNKSSSHFILLCKTVILLGCSVGNLPTIGTALPHLWHLTCWESPDSDISRLFIASSRCLSIAATSSRDGRVDQCSISSYLSG